MKPSDACCILAKSTSGYAVTQNEYICSACGLQNITVCTSMFNNKLYKDLEIIQAIHQISIVY